TLASVRASVEEPEVFREPMDRTGIMPGLSQGARGLSPPRCRGVAREEGNGFVMGAAGGASR
ncbi:hypothetical protein NS226_21740, partial [Aureimonas ureilytica]